MATVDQTLGGSTTHPTRRGSHYPYSVERVIDFAEVTTAKGSAIANGDIVNVFNVPANTLLHGAIAKVETAANTSTAATIDIDVAEGDDFVDGGDVLTAGWLAAGTNGLAPFGANTVNPIATSDTLDMKIIMPGSVALATGQVRVIAFMTDMSDLPVPTEVTRDVLA
jgi:hypothetical protein